MLIWLKPNLLIEKKSCLPEQHFGFAIAVLMRIEDAEINQNLRKHWMIRPQSLLDDARESIRFDPDDNGINGLEKGQTFTVDPSTYAF